jgi:hypothetical protein
MKTIRLCQILACLALLTASRWAEAQVGSVTMGYAGLPGKAPLGADTGVQISDGVLMHTGIGVEMGYDSNVFFSENNPQGSPIFRVLPYIELTNATRKGVAPSDVFFDLTAALTYREYISDIPEVRDQRAFMPGLGGLVEFSSKQALSFSLADTFVRTEDPPYQAGNQPIIRNVNLAAAQLRWTPGGGRLQTMVRYTNLYDDFVTDAYANLDAMSHDLMLDLSWRWLPKTALFLRASQGYTTYLKTTSKHDSSPLRLLAGIRGLVTPKVSVNLSVGYVNAFYNGGPNTSGVVGSISGIAEVTFQPTTLNTLGLGYRHDYQNSTLGNFYYMDGVFLWFQQQIAGRVAAAVSGRFEHRQFQIEDLTTGGTYIRTDNFVQAGAAIDYHAKGWFYIGVGYSMILNQSDAVSSAMLSVAGANYVKHQIFGRLGVTY